MSDYILTVSQAILGAQIPVYTLFGKKEVNIKPGTNHGDTVILEGLGVPANAQNPKKGDHVVTLKIDMPKRLNLKQENILKAFWEEYQKSKNVV